MSGHIKMKEKMIMASSLEIVGGILAFPMNMNLKGTIKWMAYPSRLLKSPASILFYLP